MLNIELIEYTLEQLEIVKKQLRNLEHHDFLKRQELESNKLIILQNLYTLAKKEVEIYKECIKRKTG